MLTTTSEAVADATISKQELERNVCTKSFYAFVKRFWDVVVPEEPVWNWHIKVICDEMQAVAERVFKGLPKEYDLVINVPPGSTKSTICSIMFPAWVWTRMPTARLICGSYSYSLGMDLSRKSRDIVQSDKYDQLFEDLKLREDQNTKGYFLNQKGGYRYTTSTGGTVMGFHGHFLLVDDPLNPQEAVSDADLKTANDWIGRTLSTRKVDKRVTPTILIMQRLHEDDPSGRMIKSHKEGKQKIRHICLPAEVFPSDGKTPGNIRDIQPRRLRRFYVDDPSLLGKQVRAKLLDPVRIPREVLEEFKAENVLGEYGYAGQMLQRPVPLEGGSFKVSRIEILPVRPAWADYVMLFRFWDKAGTAAGGAYSAGVLMGLNKDGHYDIIDVIREQLDTGTREALIKQTAYVDTIRVNVGVEQEPGSGGKESAENTIKALAGFATEIVRPTGDKETRAKPFSAQVNSGNVRLVAGEWNKDYLNELKMFPYGKFKDQVDASSGAFTLLTTGGRIGVF
jgi:predicted phage terminase large subunit-like protein